MVPPRTEQSSSSQLCSVGRPFSFLLIIFIPVKGLIEKLLFGYCGRLQSCFGDTSDHASASCQKHCYLPWRLYEDISRGSTLDLNKTLEELRRAINSIRLHSCKNPCIHVYYAQRTSACDLPIISKSHHYKSRGLPQDHSLI